MSTHWSEGVFALFKQQGIRQVSLVPDAGHSRLIELCEADSDLRLVGLTTEEEGHRAGRRRLARRRARRTADAVERRRQLHQHAVAARAAAASRSDAGDDARRVGRVQSVAGADGAGCAQLLEAMGVLVSAAQQEAEVVPLTEGALRIAYNTFRPAAVLIGQRVLGAKTFME